MKVLILRSKRIDGKSSTDYALKLDSRYADRVIGNLRSERKFCSSCDRDCIFCREPYKRHFGSDIAGVIDFPALLPYLIERPSRYIPAVIPKNDAILAISIHEQVLLEMLERCKDWGTKAVVAPLEAPDWISAAARSKANAICKAHNIEIAFPKPFCAFDPPAGSKLADFRKHFHIGSPDVELTVKDRVITNAHVNVSAACGATYYIARWLKGRNVRDNIAFEVIAKRLHSYPCTASMERDPELHDDTPLHIAGQAHYNILRPLGQFEENRETLVVTPLGKVLPRLIPMDENRKDISAVAKMVLNELALYSPRTLQELRKIPGITPAALTSALLVLKKEGRITASGWKISLTANDAE